MPLSFWAENSRVSNRRLCREAGLPAALSELTRQGYRRLSLPRSSAVSVTPKMNVEAHRPQECLAGDHRRADHRGFVEDCQAWQIGIRQETNTNRLPPSPVRRPRFQGENHLNPISRPTDHERGDPQTPGLGSGASPSPSEIPAGHRRRGDPPRPLAELEGGAFGGGSGRLPRLVGKHSHAAFIAGGQRSCPGQFPPTIRSSDLPLAGGPGRPAAAVRASGRASVRLG